MNLFKQIILRNLKDEKNHSKIINDIGEINGEFTWKAFDVKTGKLLKENKIKNAVTYLGKSSIIKLLAQSNTPHVSNFNANNYRISRLRLGNAPSDSYYSFASLNINDSTVDNTVINLPLHYYDLNEKSIRNNLTLAVGRAGAGGKCSLDSGQIQSEAGTSISQDFTVTASMASALDTLNGIIIDLNNSPFLGILADKRAPSVNSLLVEMYFPATTIPEVSAFFINNKGYNRKTHTIPIEIPNSKNHLNLDPNNGCKLFFDYFDNHWKIKIRTKAGIGSLYLNGKIRVKFEIGKYNIINSIVPKKNWNTGTGTDISSRFGGSLDYYSINMNNNFFEDSESDDIAVTFNTIINGPEGNGEFENIAGYDVVYTEAFLFNEIDELFSLVKFEDPIANPTASNLGFIKNKTISYNISWKISVFI